jgi:hypothetical protein
MTRRYEDVDIPLHIKGRSTGSHISVQTDAISVRGEANWVIRAYIEERRAQGWRTEGPTEFLNLFENSRVVYKTNWLTGASTFISAKVTFYRGE